MAYANYTKLHPMLSTTGTIYAWHPYRCAASLAVASMRVMMEMVSARTCGEEVGDE